MWVYEISHSRAGGFRLRLHDTPLWAELVVLLAHLVPVHRRGFAWLYPLFNWLHTTPDRHRRSTVEIPIDKALVDQLDPGWWDWTEEDD